MNRPADIRRYRPSARSWRIVGGVTVAAINGFIGAVAGFALGLVLQLMVTDDFAHPKVSWAPFTLGPAGALVAAGVSGLRTARRLKRPPVER